MTTATKINVWNENGSWYFAAWVDGGYDDNALLTTDDVTEAEAVELARERFGSDAVIRVVEPTA